MRALLLRVTVVTGLLAFGLLPFHASHAASTSNITDLGKPTSDVPQLPLPHLSHFRHTGPFLKLGGKPELLFIGTMVEDGSALERWPLVKALRQFGSFSGVAEAEPRECYVAQRTGLACSSLGTFEGLPTGRPTYNLEQARYTSRYLTFTTVDVVDYNLHLASHLTPTEASLLRKYVGYKHSVKDWATLAVNPPGDENSLREFPLISVGGYVETRYDAGYPDDLDVASGAPPNFIGRPEPFQAIQQSLLHHHLTDAGVTALEYPGGPTVPLGLPPTRLLSDVNAEANVIVALICHADGKKPAIVCGRKVIKHLLTYVK